MRSGSMKPKGIKFPKENEISKLDCKLPKT
jgi:hypothetical protein